MLFLLLEAIPSVIPNLEGIPDTPIVIFKTKKSDSSISTFDENENSNIKRIESKKELASIEALIKTKLLIIMRGYVSYEVGCGSYR